MHSERAGREEPRMEDRLSLNPHHRPIDGRGQGPYDGNIGFGPEGIRGPQQRFAEPYNAGGFNFRSNHYRNESADQGAGSVPKFKSYRNFCASEESAGCETAEQFNSSYKEYKQKFKNVYVDHMLAQESTFLSKVIQDRAKTSCVLARMEQRQAASQRRGQHFVETLRSGILKDISLTLNDATVNPDVSMLNTQHLPLNAKHSTVAIEIENLNRAVGDGAEGTVKEVAGYEPRSPLHVSPPVLFLDTEANTLVLREFPDGISRQEVIDFLEQHNVAHGVSELEFDYENKRVLESFWDALGNTTSEKALVAPQLIRSCRIQFETSMFAQTAMDTLQGTTITGKAPTAFNLDENMLDEAAGPRPQGEETTYTVYPVMRAPLKSVKFRILGATYCHPDQVREDLRLSAQLIRELNDKFGLTSVEGEGILVTDELIGGVETLIKKSLMNEGEDVMDDGEEKRDEDKVMAFHVESYRALTHQLDVQLSFLAYVHNLDYYGNLMHGSSFNLVEQGPYLSLRSIRPENFEAADLRLRIQKMKTDAAITLRRHGAALTNLIERIKQPFPSPVDKDHREVTASWDEFVRQNIVQAENDRARCGVCEKLFKGPEYVRKHVTNKHFDLMERVIERIDHKVMEERFKDDKLNLFLLPPPAMDESNGNREHRIVSTRDDINRTIGGSIRRGHAFRNVRSGYRDWDAPTVRIGKRAPEVPQFRQMTSYDDL